jgi:cob(I)alamin adenosyltransferase
MTDSPPTEFHRPDPVSVPSLVLVNTGNGKGKSTAAFGVVMRALGRDWKVAVVQFLKSGEWRVGEETAAKRLGADWWAIGEGFTWDSADLSEDAAIAAKAWAQAQEVIAAGEHRLVVLDEITYPINWGWIDIDDVLTTIRDRPERVNLILTGRDAPEALVDIADTVTEMTEIKHAFQRGVLAKKGIDY